ncbi:unnamed protein product [Thelazia callipaeda]|uniref:Elongator complex protein 5 n=1 Tax=Thelazia callipaeda TaxID=103827 RepID=A0A0N5CPK8_THECL|nr:unnamed protein product [Thelazia callipaeda]
MEAPSSLSKVLLMGDINDYLLNSLLANESAERKQKRELLLDTKYYQVTVKLISLRTVMSIDEWRTSRSNVDVGAVIYNWAGVFTSLQQLKQQFSDWITDIQVVVCDRSDHLLEWSEDLCRFCASKRIELVELDPDLETVKDLNECRELYGISRIREILEAGDWKNKIIKKNPFTSQEHVDAKISSVFTDNVLSRFLVNSLKDVGSDCSSVTDKDKGSILLIEVILKSFGRSNISFDSLVKHSDIPDSEVMEYFKEETEKLSRQDNMVVKVSLHIKKKVCGNGETKCVPKSDEKCSEHYLFDAKKDNVRDSSEMTRSVIDGLFSQPVNEEVTNLASKIDETRSTLLKMPFGPERQNLAADTMMAVMDSIGDNELFISSSDDESIT